MKYDIFKLCKLCQNRCCKGFIVLTEKEKKIFKKPCLFLEPCEFLKDEGCESKIKPFICEAYPLLFKEDNISINVECFIAQIYLRELLDKKSSAYRHFKVMEKRWRKLEKKDKETLSIFGSLFEKLKVRIELG